MRITQNSFAGGELSPMLYSRNDIQKYAIGLKILKNGFVHQEGAVSNRPGTVLVGEIKNSSEKVRLIPFSFNTEQTYVIEAGNKYFRFITNGGYIIYPDDYGLTYDGVYSVNSEETTEEIFAYNLGEKTIYTKTEIDEGIVCFLEKEFITEYGKVTGIDKQTMQLSIDKDEEKIAKRGQITEIETPYTTDELPFIKYSQNADVLTICHNNHPQIEVSRNSHYDWILKEINFKPKINPPQNLKASWKGSDQNPRTYSYLVTAVSDDDEESNRSEIISAEGRYESSWAVGEEMTITWDSVDNAAEYNIYKSVNGVFGYIGTSKETSFIDDKIEPDLSATAPIEKNPFENNYPAVVNYFQQRKVYGCLKNNPQKIVASQTGTSDNFNTSRPLVSTDSISLTIAEREVNEIRHIIALNDLVILTSGGEWKLNGADGSFSATSSLIATPQSFYGCSHVAPVVSGNMILFVQAGGSVLRDLGYTYVSDSYDGSELTIFANHLFKGKQIVDMAYAKEPYRLVWCCMSDGTLNVLTYNRQQEMSAWSRHETDGKFESVVCIREGNEDVAYFVINRNINGITKRYVERMATRIIDKSTDSVFLDCALKYEGAPIDELSGLEHLEGKNVYVNADGGIEQHLVENGRIKLSNKASVISVGLPYTFELETLNVEGENTHGLLKIINRISVKIENSREDFVIVGNDGSEYQNPRSLDSINDSSLLLSNNNDNTVSCFYTEEATIHIKQPYPLPLTVLSLSAEVQLANAG